MFLQQPSRRVDGGDARGLELARAVDVGDLRLEHVVEHLLLHHRLAVVDDDHLLEDLLRVLERARQLVEVPLVERGEVVDDAEEVVGELEDHVLDEVLGHLLLHHRQFRLDLHRRVRPLGVEDDEPRPFDDDVLEAQPLGRHLLPRRQRRVGQVVEHERLPLVEEPEHGDDGALPRRPRRRRGQVAVGVAVGVGRAVADAAEDGLRLRLVDRLEERLGVPHLPAVGAHLRQLVDLAHPVVHVGEVDRLAALALLEALRLDARAQRRVLRLQLPLPVPQLEPLAPRQQQHRVRLRLPPRRRLELRLRRVEALPLGQRPDGHRLGGWRGRRRAGLRGGRGRGVLERRWLLLQFWALHRSRRAKRKSGRRVSRGELCVQSVEEE